MSQTNLQSVSRRDFLKYWDIYLNVDFNSVKEA